MMAPQLKKKQEWWDNMSNKFSVTSGNKDDPPMPESVKAVAIWKDAWKFADGCAAACQAWDECLQWSFVEDLCKMDNQIMMGKGYASQMTQRKTALMTTSGWIVERLEDWNDYCAANF